MKQTTPVVQTARAKALPCRRSWVQAPTRPFVHFSYFLTLSCLQEAYLSLHWLGLGISIFWIPLLTDKQTDPGPKHKTVEAQLWRTRCASYKQNKVRKYEKWTKGSTFFLWAHGCLAHLLRFERLHFSAKSKDFKNQTFSKS